MSCPLHFLAKTCVTRFSSARLLSSLHASCLHSTLSYPPQKMGVRQLAKAIKDTKGQPTHGLQDKLVHLDLFSVYFGLIQSLCFRSLSRACAKNARSSESPPVAHSASTSTTTRTPSFNSTTEYIQPASSSHENKRRAVDTDGQRKELRTVAEVRSRLIVKTSSDKDHLRLMTCLLPYIVVSLDRRKA